jgi:hypothetical protein
MLAIGQNPYINISGLSILYASISPCNISFAKFTSPINSPKRDLKSSKN